MNSSKLSCQISRQEPAKWIEYLARFGGYGAKGLVYVVVGFLAFQAAFN